MASPPGFKILRLDRQHDDPLSSAHYLAEYEAIIVKPEWERLIAMGPDMGAVTRSEQDFHRRTLELGDFFAKGGLLVVLVVPVEDWLFQTYSPYNNHSWWTLHIAGPDVSTNEIVMHGAGTSVLPTGSGSAFDKYLERNQSYQARLGAWFDDRDRVQVLATNRAGGAIAAEVTTGEGALVCVPPPIDQTAEKLLSKAVNDFLAHRFGPGLLWPLP